METALEVHEATRATVVAATVIWHSGVGVAGAPVVARLPDGRQMALAPADDQVAVAMGELDPIGLVGGAVIVQPGPARYRLAAG